jgi:hypothetical protein
MPDRKQQEPCDVHYFCGRPPLIATLYGLTIDPLFRKIKDLSPSLLLPLRVLLQSFFYNAVLSQKVQWRRQQVHEHSAQWQ